MTQQRTSTTAKEPTKPRSKTFATLQEMTSYFFPRTDARNTRPKGDERGTETAERVFTEATHPSSK
jgi:hypothetical protein